MITLRGTKGSALTHTEHDNNFDELDKVPNGKTFPKTKGIGIKLDTDAPTFGWHDLMGVYCEPLDNPPTNALYIGGICGMQFAEGNEGMIRFHMPHDYVPDSDIFVHVHWSHNSDKVTGGSCTWVFEASYSKGHDQSAFTESKLVAMVQDVNVSTRFHQIAETSMSIAGGSATQLNTTDLEVDGVILSRLYLDSNDITTSDASVVNPFVHFVDIHYQSTGLPTKQRSPDFWT